MDFENLVSEPSPVQRLGLIFLIIFFIISIHIYKSLINAGVTQYGAEGVEHDRWARVFESGF